MEKEINILEKLSIVQNELKAPKGQKNNFGNYNYRSAEDILEAVKPLLKTNRLSLILSDDLVVLGNNNPISYTETYYDKDLKRENTRMIVNCGERYYIKATATLYDLDSDKTISNTAFAREEETKKGMDGSQITGTASSYARKYALNGLFNIDDTKDADTDEYQKQTTKNETTKKVSLATESQIKIIKEKLNEEQIKVALDLVKKQKLEDLTVVEASSLLKKLGGEK